MLFPCSFYALPMLSPQRSLPVKALLKEAKNALTIIVFFFINLDDCSANDFGK